MGFKSRVVGAFGSLGRNMFYLFKMDGWLISFKLKIYIQNIQ